MILFSVLIVCYLESTLLCCLALHESVVELWVMLRACFVKKDFDQFAINIVSLETLKYF
jgi:hypothetical protein